MQPAVLTNPQDLEQAALLRHQFFAIEKGWVPSNEQGLELDAYDPHALHFGVKQDGHLIAYMRALRGDSPCGFMLDKDFRACLSAEALAQLERRHGIELSRRVVHPELNRADAMAAVEILFQMFCQYALSDHIHAVYLVQEPSYTPMLKRLFGLNFQSLQDAPYQFADGTRVEVVAASASDLTAGLIDAGRWPRYEAFMRQYPQLFATPAEAGQPNTLTMVGA